MGRSAWGSRGHMQLCRRLELACSCLKSLHLEGIYISRIKFHAHGGAKTSFTHGLIAKENRIPNYEL